MAIKGKPYRVEQLTKAHERNQFDCGTPELNRYLQQQARQDIERRVAATFVLIAEGSPEVFGFFSLCASSIQVAELPLAMSKKLPRYPELPVILLGRLAVDIRLRGVGKGQFLLLDALRRSGETAAQIGALAVVVEAKDECAANFYRHFGFESLQTERRRLFLTMRTIDQLFA